MGNAHFPSVAATVAFIQQPFGMIQSMEQQHVYVSAIKQRQQAVFKLDTFISGAVGFFVYFCSLA